MFQRRTDKQRLGRSAAETWRLGQRYFAFSLALLGLTCAFLILKSSPPTLKRSSVVVKIPSGSSREQVADILRAKKLIRSRMVFNLITHVGYEGRPIVAGAYRMKTDMTLFEVLDKLVNGEVASVRVTIPEGYTISAIAERLQQYGVCNAASFTKAASSEAESFGYPNPTNSLEGYLFPDTYYFKMDSTADEAIELMLKAFENRVLKLFEESRAPLDYNLHQVLTVASMIEKEARIASERPVISSVIYNRIQKNMRLQIDATVIYALGRHTNRVLYGHLRTDSPYNTYKHSGLPPGPIASPGLRSVEAALNPANTDYLYYVATSDGSHLFADDFDGHRANIRKVRQ